MRLLVVDDEKLHRESMEMLLREKLPGAQTHTATNGREGVEKLLSLQFDVAFVDIRMPVLSGLEMIARYKEKKPHASTPQFVLLSGYGEFEYAREAISLGVREYLLKPLDLQELDQLLKKILPGDDAPVSRPASAPEGDEDAFTKTLDYIHANFMHPLSLEQLAGMAYFSPSYYCTLFKRRLGISFNKYLLRLRLARAEELLRLTQYRVYEIAQRTGYSDVKYFIRVFKTEYHMTPDEYRRNALAEQIERELLEGGHEDQP